MKKIIILCACIIALTSCNDDLLSVQQSQHSEVEYAQRVYTKLQLEQLAAYADILMDFYDFDYADMEIEHTAESYISFIRLCWNREDFGDTFAEMDIYEEMCLWFWRNDINI